MAILNAISVYKIVLLEQFVLVNISLLLESATVLKSVMYTYICRIPKDIAQLDLTVEKAPRQDVMFMKKVCTLVFVSCICKV